MPKMISLASGATYFNSPAVAREAALAAINRNLTFYSEAEGTSDLKQAITDRYRQENRVEIASGRILVTPGTKQALFNVLHQIIRPGDEVLIPVPNWGGLHQILAHLGATMVPFPTYPANNYAIDPAALTKALTHHTRLFLFCNPANPTGKIYNQNELEAILKVTAGFPDLYVLSDEIYDLITYGDRVPSLLEFNDVRQRHLVVNGFSKAFAMSGWRVGYLVVPPELFPDCRQFQNDTYSGVPEIVQAAAAAVMVNYRAVINDMLPVLTLNRDTMGTFLTREGISAPLPQAAYYYFPDLRQFLSEAYPTVTALAGFLQKEYQLEIFPGEKFAAPGYARLSFALPPDKLQEALNRLQTAFTNLRPANPGV